MIQAYYDQSGSIVMGPRTGTPMRLVSPAPVLVPPGAQARAPQSMYPPQPQTAQQNLYSQQNGSSVGGNMFFLCFTLHFVSNEFLFVFLVSLLLFIATICDGILQIVRLHYAFNKMQTFIIRYYNLLFRLNLPYTVICPFPFK